MRAGRKLLAGLAVMAAFAMSVSYVIPNAQAVESPETSFLVEGQQFQVSNVVTTTPADDTTDSYGFTEAPRLQWPLPADTRISTGFGYRAAPCSGCSSNHQGTDFNPPSGTPIEAMADGVVIETSAPGYAALGEHVRLQHLIDGQVVTSVYGHMIAGSRTVEVGDYVTVGQVIGNVGCTGACTGTHLHFEIHPGGGAAVDAVAWLRTKLG